MELSSQQTPECSEQVWNSFHNSVGCPQRCRKKQGADCLKRDHTHQLFLIGTIERPAAVERDQFRQHMILIRETGEGPQ